jgi:hypothetical protein
MRAAWFGHPTPEPGRKRAGRKTKGTQEPQKCWGIEGAMRQTGTDRGRFEIIYAGGAGALQAFGIRQLMA